MTPAERSCLTCVFHTLPAELGGDVHLCRLPPDCAPLADRDEDDQEDGDATDRTYLGTGCDVMRRMGAACGPHAVFWLAATHVDAAPGEDGA